jgi:GTPase KRas protein
MIQPLKYATISFDPYSLQDAYHAAVDFNGEKIFLDILDTGIYSHGDFQLIIAGQDEYSSMREQYMTSANGFILAFAINSRSSFEHLSAIRAQLLKRNPRAACVLVGTKSDLHVQRAVSISFDFFFQFKFHMYPPSYFIELFFSSFMCEFLI